MEYKPFKMKATAAGYSTPFQKNFGIGMPEGGVGSPMQLDLGDMYSKAKSKVKGAYSKTKEFLSEENLDKIQTAGDVMGMTPGVGIAADAANTIISLARGKWGEAGARAAQAIPVVGTYVAGARLGQKGYKALKAGEKVSDAYSKVDTTKQVANIITDELKNKGVVKLPSGNYAAAWKNMSPEMKKKYKSFKDFQNQAMAKSKRKQNIKT